jgi:hypothetical protein
MASVKFKIYYIKEKKNIRVDAFNKRLDYVEEIKSKE